MNAAAARSAAPAHPYRAFAARAGLGVAVVAFLLHRYDARPVFRIMARENAACFAAAIVLYIAGQVMCSYRWQLLAAIVKISGPLREFVAYYFVGAFTNLFVPGLVGGDAARSIYLGRRHARIGDAIASVIADRVVGLVALLWLAAFAAIFLNSAPLPASVTHPAIIIGALAMAAYLASPLVGRLIHILPGPIRRPAGIVAPYLHHRAALLLPLGLSLVLQIGIAFCQFLLARGLGLTVPLSLFLLCVPIANVVASLPVTLNGLGVRETANLVLFGMAGMTHDNAIALGLLWFAATTLGSLPGVIAFVTTPSPAQGSQAAAGQKIRDFS